MIRLTRAEVFRLLSRRLYRVLLVLVAGLVVLIGVLIYVQDVDITFASDAHVAMRIAAQPLFSLAVVVGASFLGAEWASGGMTTLLTWESRRGRVLASKLIAATAAAAAVTLLLEILVGLVLLPSALSHGSTLGVGGDWWWSTAGLWLRTGALGAMGAGLGLGLAGIMRNSAGPVASWLIFSFLVEQLLVIWKPWLFRWLPGANIQRFLSSGEAFGVSVDGEELFGSSVLLAGIVIAAYAAALVTASYASFRARDVS